MRVVRRPTCLNFDTARHLLTFDMLGRAGAVGSKVAVPTHAVVWLRATYKRGDWLALRHPYSPSDNIEVQIKNTNIHAQKDTEMQLSLHPSLC